MGFETIRLDVADGLATLTLDRPDALNALDDAMARELQDALEQVSRDSDLRALLLTGAGRAFCSGQDLKAVTGDGSPSSLGDHLARTWNPIVEAVHALDRPTVCAINGVAAGAGASLALACDLRIASEKASIIIVFSKVGLVPDSGATWLLPRLVGLGKALELAFTADPVPAPEALRLGLVNRVVGPDDLQAEARTLAARLAAGPTKAYGWTKRAMERAFGTTFGEALAYEAELQTAAGRSADYAEGLQAFLEKRAPAFEGR